METEITQLKLVSPLYYIPLENPGIFGNGEEGEYEPDGETLVCFELDENERLSFEPEKQKLLGNPVFAGKAAGEAEREKALAELPGGDYLFAQKRERLSGEEIIALALEIQQEGLWRRLLPGNRLYLRRLFEDGRRVTQLFRPYTQPDQT